MPISDTTNNRRECREEEDRPADNTCTRAPTLRALRVPTLAAARLGGVGTSTPPEEAWLDEEPQEEGDSVGDHDLRCSASQRTRENDLRAGGQLTLTRRWREGW